MEEDESKEEKKMLLNIFFPNDSKFPSSPKGTKSISLFLILESY